MLIFQRTMAVKLGKFGKASEFGRALKRIAKDKLGQDMQVYYQAYGDKPRSTMYFVTQHEDMAAHLDYLSSLDGLEDYLEIAIPSLDYFISGTTFDNILRVIE